MTGRDENVAACPPACPPAMASQDLVRDMLSRGVGCEMAYAGLVRRTSQDRLPDSLDPEWSARFNVGGQEPASSGVGGDGKALVGLVATTSRVAQFPETRLPHN